MFEGLAHSLRTSGGSVCRFLYTVIRGYWFPAKLIVGKTPPAILVAAKAFMAHALIMLDFRSGCVRGVGCSLGLCCR